MSKDYRRNPGIEQLERSLRNTMSNIRHGKFQYETKTHEPGTGRPWVQTQRIRFGHIDGWAAVDGYDSVNCDFVKLSKEEIFSAIVNRQGVFASTDTLKGVEYPPVFLTHHIASNVSTNRLFWDMRTMFDLSLILRWNEEHIHREIMPNCRVHDQLIQTAEEQKRLIVFKIGTESDLRSIAENGCNTTEENTRTLGVFQRNERSFIENLIAESVQQYLLETFDGGLKWGEHVPVDQNTDQEILQNIVLTI